MGACAGGEAWSGGWGVGACAGAEVGACAGGEADARAGGRAPSGGRGPGNILRERVLFQAWDSDEAAKGVNGGLEA
jgi:hypothetical protein